MNTFIEGVIEQIHSGNYSFIGLLSSINDSVCVDKVDVKDFEPVFKAIVDNDKKEYSEIKRWLDDLHKQVIGDKVYSALVDAYRVKHITNKSRIGRSDQLTDKIYDNVPSVKVVDRYTYRKEIIRQIHSGEFDHELWEDLQIDDMKSVFDTAVKGDTREYFDVKKSLDSARKQKTLPKNIYSFLVTAYKNKHITRRIIDRDNDFDDLMHKIYRASGDDHFSGRKNDYHIDKPELDQFNTLMSDIYGTSETNGMPVGISSASQLLCTTSIPLDRATQRSAGHDIKSLENVIIPAKGTAIVDTGVSISIPDDYYVEIKSRSGLAFRHGVEAFSGVIDADYKDGIKVLLRNFSDIDHEIKKGDRIAQLILHKYYVFDNANVLQYSDTHIGFGASGR